MTKEDARRFMSRREFLAGGLAAFARLPARNSLRQLERLPSSLAMTR